MSDQPQPTRPTHTPSPLKRADEVTTVVIMVLTVIYLVVARGYPEGARTIPTIVGGVTLLVAGVQLLGPRIKVLRPFVGDFRPVEEGEVFLSPGMRKRLLIVSATLLALPVMIVLLGIVVALPIYVALFVLFLGRRSLLVTAVCTAAIAAAVYGLLVLLLGMPWNDGRLWELL